MLLNLTKLNVRNINYHIFLWLRANRRKSKKTIYTATVVFSSGFEMVSTRVFSLSHTSNFIIECISRTNDERNFWSVFMCVLLVVKNIKVPVQSPFIRKTNEISKHEPEKKRKKQRAEKCPWKAPRKYWPASIARLFNQSHKALSICLQSIGWNFSFWNVKSRRWGRRKMCKTRKKMLTKTVYLEMFMWFSFTWSRKKVKIMLFLNWRKWSFFVSSVFERIMSSDVQALPPWISHKRKWIFLLARESFKNFHAKSFRLQLTHSSSFE